MDSANRSQRNNQLWAQWRDERPRRAPSTRIATNEPNIVERNVADEQPGVAAPAPIARPGPPGATASEQSLAPAEDMRGTVAIRRAPAR